MRKGKRGGDRQLREVTEKRREGAGGWKGRKRVGGEWKQTQNASQKSSEDKNKEVGVKV